MSVPPQNSTTWYPEQGRIEAEKERIAWIISEKYGLSVGKPPDEPLRCLFQRSERTNCHRHLEFANRWETIIVAHPIFLKVRMIGTTSGMRYVPKGTGPLLFRPELLQDLSTLYPA